MYEFCFVNHSKYGDGYAKEKKTTIPSFDFSRFRNGGRCHYHNDRIETRRFTRQVNIKFSYSEPRRFGIDDVVATL